MDCIVEDMAPKAELFSSLPEAVKRRAIFITTTSGLSITELGRQSGTGHLLAGTHFWNPPHLMPLVEVVRGEDTPDHVLEQVTEVVRSIGKIPVRVNRDVPGFIGNRLLHAMWREAIYLVQEGIATPQDIDLVSRLTFGLRMPVVGPLENMDLVGLDLIERIHAYLLADLSGAKEPLKGLADRVKQDDLGLKTGRGFYDWKERDGDQLIERRDAQIVNQLEFLKELDADS
jgi:3-hydroxybutyryl-CoA dehydrogenase